MGHDINKMVLGSGRILKENNQVVNIGDLLETLGSKIDSVDTALDLVYAVIDSIKSTDGVKKITDALPPGTNELGTVLVTGRFAQVGTDQTATFANSAPQNTTVNIDIPAPENIRPKYKIAILNPSTVAGLTILVESKSLNFGGGTQYNLIDTITIPPAQVIKGALVSGYAKFIAGIFNGTDLRLAVSIDPIANGALGAADGFSAYIRVREAG